MQLVPSPDGHRFPPTGRPDQWRSFQIVMPRATHYRKASCDEVDCDPFLKGWTTTVDERTELGQSQAYYIRHDAGRGFREERLPDGRTAFHFPPGQRCFKSDEHLQPTGKPELYIARDGDWRGNPTGRVTRHDNPDHWVEEFAENQEIIATQIARG